MTSQDSLYFTVLTTGSQASQESVYYGFTGYTGFNGSTVLEGAGMRLSIIFRFCNEGGLLLEATEGGRGRGYFSLGITSNGQLLVEFSDGRVIQVRLPYNTLFWRNSTFDFFMNLFLKLFT